MQTAGDEERAIAGNPAPMRRQVLLLLLLLAVFFGSFLLFTASARVFSGGVDIYGLCLMGAVFLFGGAAMLIAFRLLFFSRRALHTVYLFAALFFGLVSCLINPPGSTPDEGAHFSCVYLWSNRVLGIRESNSAEQSNAVYVEKDSFIREGDRRLFALSYNYSVTRDSYRSMWTNFELFSSRDERALVSYHFRDHSVAPIGYLPAIAGVTAARLIGLGFIPLLYLGRLCMLAVFAFGTWWSIRKAPVGKPIFFVCGLLPICMHLAGTYSYDSVILTLCFMLIAQLLYLIAGGDEPIQLKQMLFAALLMFLLAPNKIAAYLPIALLVFLIPKQRFAGTRFTRLGLFAAVLGSGLLAVVAFNLPVFAAFLSPQGAAPASDHSGFTVAALLRQPLRTAKLLFNTTYTMLNEYFVGMIGQDPRWYHIFFNPRTIAGFALLLLAACVTESGEKELHLSGAQRAFLLAPPMLSYLVFALGMLLWWTPVSSDIILGIQGRYFTPVLPLVCLAISKNPFTARPGTWRYIALTAVFLEANTFLFLMAAVLRGS